MSTDLSLITLLIHASLPVQLVMLLLLAASVASWTMIFRKWKDLKEAHRAATAFEGQFWSGSDLSALYQQVSAKQENPGGLEGLFEAGFKEFVRLRKQSTMTPAVVMEGTQRAMRVALSRESAALETYLPFLATIGSTSPYVGLLGTVWGIMNSFRALGTVKQATLAMVAPGIAEALIATAMGLFAAIPAVIAYNHYRNDAERLIARYDTFLEEFANILRRQAHEQAP